MKAETCLVESIGPQSLGRVDHPRVLVFTEEILSASTTFIRSQMESLEWFEPHYVGLKYSSDISLDSKRVYVLSYGGVVGKLRVWMFKLIADSIGIRRRVKNVNPCLIHAHFGPNGAMCLGLRRMLKVPLVVTFHGYDATVSGVHAHEAFRGYKVYLRRRKNLIKQGDLFIAVSHFIREKLVGQGFPSERIRVHYIGVDTDFFCPHPGVKREPYVLFVGRLVEKKGCEYLVRAFVRIKNAVPHAKLVAVGDGPLLPHLEQLARSHNVPCQFLGKQPSAVVKEWMNKSMVLCAPSVTAQSGDAEGLPIVVLEAGAMGLPVVGTIHAGIPEAISHGYTGLLVAERDEQGLAEALTVLLSHRETWTRLHMASMVHVREHFDLKKQTRLLEKIYESILYNHQHKEVARDA